MDELSFCIASIGRQARSKSSRCVWNYDHSIWSCFPDLGWRAKSAIDDGGRPYNMWCWSRHCINLCSVVSEVGDVVTLWYITLTFCSEVPPAEHCGRYVVINHVGLVVGLALAFWLVTLVVPVSTGRLTPAQGRTRHKSLGHRTWKLSRLESIYGPANNTRGLIPNGCILLP